MQLVQLNIAHPLEPLESERLKEFVDNLDKINAIAESAPGFIWRLKDEQNDATSFRFKNMPDIIINMSVWDSAESLKQFVYHTTHVEFLQRKKEWFHKLKNHQVMWHIEDSHTPTLEEAEIRLNLLKDVGETEQAFTFRYLTNVST